MKLKFLYFLAFCLLVLYVLQSNSSGVATVQGQDRTGSPIAGGLNCGLCHGGAFNNAAMTITVLDALSQPVTDYVPGDTYTVEFLVSKQAGFTHGMQAVALTSSNDQAGFFNTPGTNTKITALTRTSGAFQGTRQYIEHTNAVIALNDVLFSVNWVAPPIGTGDVTVYASGVVGGGAGTNNSDPIAPFNIVLTERIAASIDYAQASYCQNDFNPTPTQLGPTGGTYTASPSGLTISPTTGFINLSTSALGTYTVTYTTSTSTATDQVSIVAADDASFAYSSASYCENGTDPMPTITGLAGGYFLGTNNLAIDSTTGRIDLSASGVGSYVVSYYTNGSCPAQSIANIDITTASNASFSYPNTSYCQNGSDPSPTPAVGGGTYSSAPSGLSLNPNTGQIDLSASSVGNYTVTYTVTGTCTNSSTQTVNVVAPDDASFSYTSANYCQNSNDPIPTVTGLAGGQFSSTPGLALNATTGQIDLSNSTIGSYVVTYTTAGSCPNSSNITLAVTAPDNALFTYSSSNYCQNGADPTPAVTGLAGGQFSSTAGLIINANTGQIDVSGSTLGTYVVTYTTAGQCPNSSTQSVTLDAADDASFAYANNSYCRNATDPTPTLTGLTGGTFSAPSGLIINSSTGIVDLSASSVGNYTVTYTTAGACPNSSTFALSVTNIDDASFAYANNNYCQNGTNPTPTITGLSGGTFSANSGLVINSNTGAIDVANSTIGTYTVTYTTNGSCSNSSTQSVTISAPDNAGFSYAAAQYCQGPNANPSPIITGLTGGTFSAPAGLIINSSTGQINLNNSTVGTYTVTYTTAGNCPNTATNTVTINALDDASFAYANNNYCINDADPTPNITGLAGGTFSSTAGLAINASTGQIDVSSSTIGTYTVTYTTNGTCPNGGTQVVSVNGLDNASFSYTANSYCQAGSDPSPTITGLAGGTFSSAAGLSINANTGQIDVSGSTPGTYVVTYTTNGTCPNSATNSVTILTPSNANFNYNQNSYCINGSNPTPTITGVSGGSFSSTMGLSINANTGEINLSASTVGTYTVTYSVNTNCSSSSTQTVVIQSLDDASFAYGNSSYCTSGSNPAPTVTGLSGGTFSSSNSGLVINATSGTINLSASTIGTYVVTYQTNGNCPNSSSQTVNITAPSNANFTYNQSSYCPTDSDPTPNLTGVSGGSFSSTAGLTLNATTGVVDLSASTAGTYTITYTIGGTCPNTSTQSFTLTPLDNAAFGYAQNGYCQTDADPTPTVTGLSGGTFGSTAGLALNASTGTIDVSASTPGTYGVTYTTNGTCPNTSTQTVIINAAGNTSFTYANASYCQNAGNPSPVVTGSQGGTFSSSAGLAINASTGEVNLANSTTGTYTITYTVSGTCGSVTTQNLIIAPVDNANFNYNQTNYCQTDADPTPTITGVSGGTFSSSAGLSINPTTGVIDVSASTPSSYTVTYTTTGSCPSSATATVVINAGTTAGFAYANNNYCQSSNDPTPVVSGTTGGIFGSTAGLSINANTGTIDLSASTAGSYTITYTVSGSCGSSSNQSVTITPIDNANFSYSQSGYCQTDADPTPTITGAAGGTFSSSPGLSLNANTGAIDVSASTPGTYTVTYLTGSNCPGSEDRTVVINAAGNTSFAYTSGSFCQDATDPTPTIIGNQGGTFSSSIGLVINTNTGLIDLSASTTGTYTVTYTVTGACGSVSTQNVAVDPVDDANFSYPQNSYCQTDADPTPIITGISGGVFTGSPAGLSLNAVTGAIDVSASTPNTYTITYTTNGNCPGSEVRTVVINAAGATSFAYANSNYCQNANNPTPIITGNQSGTFSSTGGLVINANTGQIDLSASTTGTYTITYTVSGTCGSSSSQTVTVAPVQSPAFTYNASAYCQNDSDPTPTITGVSGGVFTGSPAGLSLSAATGTIDVSASSVGTYTITYTTSGNCPDSQSSTVVINAAGSTSFAYSASNYCQSASDPTPTVSGSLGGTFSSTAGLSIDPSTGTVDLSASNAGTYTVSYAALGTCGGTSTQQLTVDSTDNANFSYNQNSYCQSASDPTPTLASTLVTGLFSSNNGLAINAGTGIIDVSASTPGTYTVTFSTNSTCPSSATTTVVIIASDDATFAYNSTIYCQNANDPTPVLSGTGGGVFSASAGLVLNAATGAIDLSASTAGTYTVSYTTNGTCPASNSQSITISTADNASFTYNNNSYCQTDADPTPVVTGTTGGLFTSATGLVLNSSTGFIDLSASTPGTYAITYTTGGNCFASSSQTVTVNAAGNLSINYSSNSYCQSANDPTPTITGSSTGQFSATAGLAINPTTGQIDVSASTLGTYTITYTAGGPCAGAATTTVTINSIDDASFNYTSNTICQNASDPVANLTGTTGGTFSSTAGLVLNNSDGTIDASASLLGTYVVTYTTSGVCSNSSSQTVTVNAAEDASFAYNASSTCTSGSDLSATILGTPGGTFTTMSSGLAINPTTGLINASSSTPGTYTVRYTTSGACPSTSSVQIVISSPDNPNFSYGGAAFCQNTTDPVPTITQTGGTFTATPAGLALNASTGEIDLSNSAVGNYSIRYITNGPCPDSSLQPFAVLNANSAAFAYSSSAYCQNNSSNPTPTITGSTGGVFSSTPGLVLDTATGEIDLTASALGSYVISYTVSTGCPDIGYFVVNILSQGVVFFGYSDTSICLNYGNSTIPLATASPGSFSATPTGLVFANANTGEVDAAASTPGTYLVRYTTGGNCPTTRAVNVVADICTGVRQLADATKYQLYPNPNTGQFLLEYDGETTVVEVAVLDVLGKVVHFQEVELSLNAPVRLELPNAVSGTYWVRLQTENTVSTLKMIVSKP